MGCIQEIISYAYHIHNYDSKTPSKFEIKPFFKRKTLKLLDHIVFYSNFTISTLSRTRSRDISLKTFPRVHTAKSFRVNQFRKFSLVATR